MPRDIAARKGENATSGGPSPRRVAFSGKGDKQQENQISVHLCLKLKVARKIFRGDLAHSAFELERGVQRVIQFFNKRDQRSDVRGPQPRTRIVLFKLFNQPAGIINADVKLVAGSPQKRAREFAQFPEPMSLPTSTTARSASDQSGNLPD